MNAGDIVRYGQLPDAVCRLVERQNHGSQRGWRAVLYSGNPGAMLDTELSEASAADIALFERREAFHPK